MISGTSFQLPDEPEIKPFNVDFDGMAAAGRVLEQVD